ncbi:hypothetical protein IWT25_01366 [Secundilactobacillus pentosiphilus]|uniref:DUF1275 family protein n=1 Tax=Secundilactobacillus pentosiphilus TaxID=1714682 RepID=A0A1Z5IX54_9LACO|nr:YoaK family protein [Secundilactobacillus pentosiphilus]GAX06041.1 hypothetical protein IWT25_01366 [Secundilactobacillus pentosiphilus]
MTTNRLSFSWLTFLATFSMGAVDAYTYIAHNETFASAQTGNLIVFAVKFAHGGFSEAWVCLPIWIGFALGCFVAQAALSWLNHKPNLRQRYLRLMGIVVFTLLVVTLGQEWFGELVMIFILGWLAGYELTSFREVKDTTVNNGIMTGNTKNMMVALYHWLIDHDRADRSKFLWLAATMAMFVAGAGLSAMVCIKISSNLVLWAVLGINAAGLLVIYLTSRFRNNA